jgi:hypothetical protein
VSGRSTYVQTIDSMTMPSSSFEAGGGAAAETTQTTLVTEDAGWIVTIVVSVYMTAFLLPLILSGVVLFVSGSLTWKWVYDSGYLLIAIGNFVVFLPILYRLKREGAE